MDALTEAGRTPLHWHSARIERRELTARWDDERLAELAVELSGEASALPKLYSRSELSRRGRARRRGRR